MKVIYDIEKHSYDFYEFENIEFLDHFLKIGFRNNGELPVYFSDLSAKVDIFGDEGKVFSQSFPDEGETYISTDQDYVWGFNLYGIIIPEKNYVLEIEISNSNHQEFVIQNFSLNRPEAPYPSWTWNAEIGQWLPPTPYPADAENFNEFIWSEELGSWIPAPIEE